MRSTRIYQMRRGILEALSEYGRPCSLDDLLGYPVLMALHSTREELLSEWNALNTYEFIEPAQGSNGEYCKISSSGLAQINKEVDLNSKIWGKYALK